MITVLSTKNHVLFVKIVSVNVLKLFLTSNFRYNKQYCGSLVIWLVNSKLNCRQLIIDLIFTNLAVENDSAMRVLLNKEVDKSHVNLNLPNSNDSYPNNDTNINKCQ